MSDQHPTDFINDRHERPEQPSHIYRVKFNPLSPDAILPQRGSLFAAGFDLYSACDKWIENGCITTIDTGFSTEMPSEIHGRIESRSGMAIKGLAVITGVIDSDYRGEWKIIMGNLSGERQHIAKGDRVAQVVFRPTVAVAFELVSKPSELSESARGASGFGSTGTR